MEFQGRITKLLPIRQGVSQRTGNEWKAQPFIFEYFEHESDRYADSVMLETFDTNVIDHLKEGMEVRCGFSHRVREYQGKQYNELRLYKIESVKKGQQQPTADAAGTVATQQPAPQTQATNPENEDLPF